MRDFTLKTYKDLLYALQAQGYAFQPYAEFLKTPQNNAIILRHDVDLLPANSLVFAQMQNQLGIRGSYYFRAVPESWDEEIIKAIAALGHEIGYHYECLTTCKGNLDRALDDFKTNLEALRKLVPVETICMHGSPRSEFDSKDLWKSHNYRDFGIIGEPYFDTDFSQVMYLTDTGRRWDGDKVSVRDKVQSSKFEVSGWRFKCTIDIINAANRGDLPDQIMFTFHPQRWTEKSLPWVKELVLQNIKNVIKFYLIKTRTRK
ncbi:MAG: hypothetical protein IPM71_08895 [Bacteroidota bacterium]|nr:MAG: hypothetical protein IPM71_08895 [Bacteroidota bacterium]